jgi:cytosine/adenosine deaminase-related metal-dependent hydrolase
MVADGRGVVGCPGAVLVEGHDVIAAGTPQAVGRPAGAAIVNEPAAVVIPALVNAHCHLDLTHIGPVAYSGDLVSWLTMVRDARATGEHGLADSVRRGVALSRVGGTALVGDIAGGGSPVPIRALRGEGMGGVSFLEVFGLGSRQADGVARLRHGLELADEPAEGVELGLQPHAPYSCGADVYRAAAGMQRPLATHLAEALEELEFVRSATGPLVGLLKAVGAWDESITGSGKHPVDHLAEVLEAAPFIAAHLNYVDDRHLAAMAAWPLTVAYCPRASRYFGHPQQGRPYHRYRDMLEAGINVALGTDSMLCLDTPDRISVLDEMRLLHRRDGTDPITLLHMATVAGATALGFDASLVTVEPGPVAGLLAVAIDADDRTDPLRQIVSRDDSPRWLIGPVEGRELV